MISVEQLLADARAQAGLDDLGDDSILGPLELLVDSLNREAKLTDRGEQTFATLLVRNLVNRLKVEKWLGEHPEALAKPIDRPMFVFGLPRTGTTLTINLLNQDPARRCFLRLEMLDSVPPPTPEELHAGPRFDAAQAQVDMSLKYMPHISAIHHEDADSPSECQFAMSQSFCAQVYESQADIPTYRDWFMHKADYLPAFRYQKRLLQLLQVNAPGRWTLKNPWHPLFLPALNQVYPEAQLVMTHRDPVAVVGSACSLIKAVRQMFSDDVDLHRIGSSMVDTFETMIARADAFQAERGEGSIHHLRYADQMRDPIGTIRKVYDHFGEPLTEEAEAAMRRYIDANPKGKHGKHEYRLEDYGLTKDMIRERFGDYCRKYDIAEGG